MKFGYELIIPQASALSTWSIGPAPIGKRRHSDGPLRLAADLQQSADTDPVEAGSVSD